VTGAVLAGGRGSRLGGGKAAIEIGGRAMIERPLEAVGQVCERVAVVCKRESVLPALPPGVERWDEPDLPRHPSAGIVHALRRAGGAVLVCAADMPFVDPVVLRELIAAGRGDPRRAAVVAEAEGRLEPVLGLYRPAALEALTEAPVDAPLTRTVEALDPVRVEVDAGRVASVNTPAELAAAEHRLVSAAQEQRD
jgi:molybdopterin-guanine dinucleotide biosynthesis protein A